MKELCTDNLNEELKNALTNNAWIIDATDLDKGMIIIHKEQSIYYAIQLFEGEGADSDWLADEEAIANNEPLWFSADACIDSPIFQLMENLKERKMDGVNVQMIVLLMPEQNIINYEDMMDTWKELGVEIIPLSRFIQEINTYNIPLFRTLTTDFYSTDDDDINPEVDDVNAEADDDSNEDDDTIHKFIKKSRHIILPKFKDIKFSMFSYDNKENSKPTDSVYFRYKIGDILCAWLDLESDDEWKDLTSPIIVTLYNDLDIQLVKREVYSKPKINESDPNRRIFPNVDFDVPGDLEIGEYWCYITYKGKKLHSQKIVIVNMKESADQAVEVDAFGIIRNNIIVDSDKKDDSDILSCMNLENLAGVNVLMNLVSRVEHPINFEVTLKIFNELGKVLYFSREECSLNMKGEAEFVNVEVGDVVCAAGRYVAQFAFLGEPIVEAQFTVGTKDVSAKYKITNLRPNPNRFITPFKGVEGTAMQRLMGLVGLSRLKSQIKSLESLTMINNLRKKKGLPTKPSQLHFAFLGNPGTGKTMVASLLGEVYKDLGILSKGHVVLKERSTLMTQNWGGEGDKVQEALQEARGGVLFIDEAYDLVTNHPNDPGRLIISALLTAMGDENNRDLLVIFAGYTMPMEKLLNVNSGLNSRLEKLYFDDYSEKELVQIAELWAARNCYRFTEKAKKQLRIEISSAYATRTNDFGNGRYIINLMEKQVQPAMAERLLQLEGDLTIDTLTQIEESDIPNHSVVNNPESAFDKLNKMVGLNTLKEQFGRHLSLMRFVAARRKCNIDTPIPPMHMVFTGNPGTGKSTVADYIGEIYRSMGILRVGNVIKVTRADIVDTVVGGTEQKMQNLLNAAHGNILFIDEAYTLLGDGNDPGERAVELLLDALGREQVDFIVVLAGYAEPMRELLATNIGLKSRFPYIFHFNDYTEAELLLIAQDMAERNNLILSKGAIKAISALIHKEILHRDNTFSNARYVVRLITTQILPLMSQRLLGETSARKLKTVLAKDVPISAEDVKMINEELFDEAAITRALTRLDSLVGLSKVKSAIHQFVSFARSLNSGDSKKMLRDYNLKWSFVGNTGTGKSTIAEILAEILKGMHLLNSGHTVELKAEEIYAVSGYQADELIKRKMSESSQGLLFVDGDAPEFKSPDSRFNPDYLRMCLATNTLGLPGRFAVVIAEHSSPRVELARSLSHIGIQDFDHILIFDDYTSSELLAILIQCLDKLGLKLDNEAEDILHTYISRLVEDFRNIYANARTMKHLAEAIHKLELTSVTNDGIITKTEVAPFISSTPFGSKRIGY